MSLPPGIKQANNVLKGYPDTTLTLLLIVAAVVLAIVAFKAPPLLKAAVLAWVILP